MEIYKDSDIDFTKLKQSAVQGTKSIVFMDGDNIIKIFSNLYPEELSSMQKKLLKMDGIEIDGVMLPKGLILKDGNLVGYIMDNFKNSVNLLDFFFRSRFINAKEIINYTEKVSKKLREIHDVGIVCQDFTFDNVLVNHDGEIAFTDMDGCTYAGINSPYISVLLKRFVIDYRKNRLCYISPNMDNLSLLLSFYFSMFSVELQKLNSKKFHKLSDKINTLENTRDIANQILSYRTLPEIPYFDEFVDSNDGDCIIDRNEQISRIRRLFNR